MYEFVYEFVYEFFANFVHEFKYKICTNSRIRRNFFARKIGYVTNGLYCNCTIKLKKIVVWVNLRENSKFSVLSMV